MCDGGDTTSVALANDAPAARSYTRRMSVRRLTPLLAAAALAAVPLAGAGAQAPSTPDQRFVAELKSARQAGRPRSASCRRGASPSTRGAAQSMSRRRRRRRSPAPSYTSGARHRLRRKLWADQIPEIAASVSTATKLSAQAASQMRRADYNGARESIDLVLKASQAALTAFGVPLAKEFQATATYRELGNIQGWEEYLGLGAKVNAPIAKIVIGILGRPTANMGEAGGKKVGALAADHEACDLHAPGAERRVQLRLGQDRQRHHRVRPQPDDEGERVVCRLLRPEGGEGYKVPLEVLVDGRPPLIRRPHDEVALANSRRERRGTACRAAPGSCRASGSGGRSSSVDVR